MKIALYVGTVILFLLGLMLFGAGMESLNSDPAMMQMSFSLCAVLLGILASWWLCALSGHGLWVFAARSVGFTLCLYPPLMLFCAPAYFSPWLGIAQMGVGCALLLGTPSFAAVRLGKGFLGGALLLLGIMGAMGVLPGGLWGGIATAAAGCALLLMRQRFSPLLLGTNFAGSFLMLASFVLFALHGSVDSTMSIVGLTLGLIGGGTFIALPLTLERSQLFKVVGKAGGHTLDDLYEAMKGSDTVLGTPWMCSVPLLGRAIIFGPNESGASIYFAKAFGHIIFGLLQTTVGLQPDPKDAGRLERRVKVPQGRKEIWGYALELIEFNNAVIAAVQRYLAGEAFSAPPRGVASGTLCTFDEDFRLISQHFALQTLDGKALYTIDAPLPFITFTIKDAISSDEVLVVKKRFLRMRQQYDFYWKGEHYGTFAKQLDAMDDIFTMTTPEGLLVMQEVQGTLGANYTVRLGETLIGSIACKLNPTLSNVFLDNYLIHIREKKYTPLLAALGAMSAREQSRDRASSLRLWTR